MKRQAQVVAVILAAGQGKRMGSPLPKVLLPLSGRPMLSMVSQALKIAGIEQQIVVMPKEHKAFQGFIEQNPSLAFVTQDEPRGTGDAVASGLLGIKGLGRIDYAKGNLIHGHPYAADYIMITTGDTPAIEPSTISSFANFVLDNDYDVSVCATHYESPFGYGRIIRGEMGRLLAIVEEKDATEAEKKISLCHTGVMMAKREALFSCLQQLTTENAQKEYYLTDVIKVAKGIGLNLGVFISPNELQFSGVNTPEQRDRLERYLQR